MSYKRIAILFTIIGVILFVTSLTQKCYCLGSECGDSIVVLFFGWLGVLLEIGHVADFIFAKIQGKETVFNTKIGGTISWLANPLIIISFFTLSSRYKTSIIITALATLLILSFLLFDCVIATEAGHYNQITEYKAGYFLWLTSSITMLTGSIYLLHKSECSTRIEF